MIDKLTQRELEEQIYKYNLSFFIRRVFRTVDPASTYSHNWHIDIISEYLEACRRKEVKRLLINMPPRSLKSISASVAFPAFILGHNPKDRVMVASYSQKLSFDHSLATRHVITSDWYQRLFPDTMLARDQNEKSRFQTTEQGMRMATSVGSSTTGFGASYLITDDAHDPGGAESDVQRQTAIDWFDQTYSTRLNNRKEDVMIVVMQRLHSKDLSGHLLEAGGWEHLCLQAEAEERKTYSFGGFTKTVEKGELMHPDRLGERELEQLKQQLKHGYYGQFQQRPTPRGGGIIELKWFKRYNVAPENPTMIVQSWDTAHKANAGSDYSVCATFAQTANGHYLLDIYRAQLEYPDLKRTVSSLHQKYMPHTVLIEDKASGQSLLQDFARDGNMSCIAIKPDKDKVTRASTASGMIEGGNVYLPEKAAWLVDFENEVETFPRGAHDDMVDAITQYLNWIRLKQGITPSIRML